jgi:ankyrin repeat protein
VAKPRSALHLAVEYAQSEAALLLLNSGALVDATNSLGWTALHIAAQATSPEMAALLLAHGADVNAKARKGMMPQHMSAFHGKLSATKLLILRGAELDAVSKDGYTALDDAKCLVRMLNEPFTQNTATRHARASSTISSSSGERSSVIHAIWTSARPAAAAHMRELA